MNKRIGLLTIGQSPRIDVVPEIASFLGEEYEIIEAGALDGLSKNEIAKLAPKVGETVYVSRLRDGSEVRLSKERIIPLLQDKIEFLEKCGANVIGLLCSGIFPDFESRVPLVKPEPILRGIVKSMSSPNMVLGIIMPNPVQISFAREKWSNIKCKSMVIDSISPYAIEEHKIIKLKIIARRFRDLDVNVVVMDCIGFSINDAKLLKSELNVPILIPRLALALALKSII